MSKISKSSNAQEQASVDRYASTFRAQRVARSGAGVLKGDVALQVSRRLHWMGECKETHKESMTFKRAWWHTLVENAVRESKDPMLEIRLGKYKYVGFEFNKFQELLQLSKLPKPFGFSRIEYVSRNGAVSVTMHTPDLIGLERRASKASADFKKIDIVFMDMFGKQELHLVFVDVDFSEKLFVSVYDGQA